MVRASAAIAAENTGEAVVKHSEKVTFGGGGLDRAAHIRGSGPALAAAWEDPGTRVLLFWRGKPLARTSGGAVQGLAFLPANHAVAAPLQDEAVFLGKDLDGAPLFACALSDWEPEGLDSSQLGLFLDPSEQQHPQLPDNMVFAELRRIMTLLTPLEAEAAAAAKAVLAWHESHGFCARCGVASLPAEGGWQRNCPSCYTPHFPRTDPVVIMLITHGDSLLLGRSPGWPKGMYSLLAGFVEPGETLEAAVRREVFEETAVPVAEVGYLASQPWAFPMSLMIGCSGRALSRSIRIDPQEIEDARWVSRADLMQVFAGEHPDIRPARNGSIAHFLMFNWLADNLD
jgi:NAD+ diphosphatase